MTDTTLLPPTDEKEPDGEAIMWVLKKAKADAQREDRSRRIRQGIAAKKAQRAKEQEGPQP